MMISAYAKNEHANSCTLTTCMTVSLSSYLTILFFQHFAALVCCLFGYVMLYDNSYDGELLFECATHDQSVSYVHSLHDNHHEDRIFEFHCRSLGVEINEMPTCSWTNGKVFYYKNFK